MYKRNLSLSTLKESFFLWGPRQVGKSSLLRASFPRAFYLDLLQSELFARYQTRPYLLREDTAHLKAGEWVILDEIQKVPSLLDEVHHLIENQGLRFGLCGSSARKVKRGHANLLGGRALRRNLLGLSANEMGTDFNLVKFLNQGYLPPITDSENYKDKLRSYCADYLKEEIAAEGLVRNLPSFSQFLEFAALSDTEQISFISFARESSVSAPTIKTYFEILEDTMLGNFLPAYRVRPKRRLETSPKFYFFDVGVVNSLAKRGSVEPRSELFGKAFENWVHHELRTYQAYRMQDLDLSFWRTSSQIEVDFVLGKMEVAIEAKGTSNVHGEHLKGLREIKKDYPKLRRQIVVSFESRERITEDKIEILPYRRFIEELWSGKLIR